MLWWILIGPSTGSSALFLREACTRGDLKSFAYPGGEVKDSLAHKADSENEKLTDGSCCFYGAAHRGDGDGDDGCVRAHCEGDSVSCFGDGSLDGVYQAGCDGDDVLGCRCSTTAGTCRCVGKVFGCWCSTNAGTREAVSCGRSAMRLVESMRTMERGAMRGKWRHERGAMLGRRCSTTTGIGEPDEAGLVLGCRCFTDAGTKERAENGENAFRSVRRNRREERERMCGLRCEGGMSVGPYGPCVSFADVAA